MDSSKLACYINNTNTIGKYILDNSDCSSLSDTAITALSDTKVIIDHLPTIIISVSVLIVITVALAVFIYYRYSDVLTKQRDVCVIILINPEDFTLLISCPGCNI